MNHYLFKIKENTTDALKALQDKGLQEIYIIEDEETKEILIGGSSSQVITYEEAMEVSQNHSIDWAKQWESFAQNFHDGHAHIDLSEFGANQRLLLTPGEGFGDLSHPTTYLMLKMMKEKVQGKTILDIGTGSGILSLASLFLGAKSAIGVDIDPKAISHAKQNSKLNSLDSKTTFRKTIPKVLSKSTIALMNMLPHEQKMIPITKLNPKVQSWIVSGVLEEKREEYLTQTASLGWEIIEEHHHLGWMGWIFKNR